MRILDAAAVAAATPYPALIDALADAFAGRVACTAPPRGHHAVPRPGEASRTLLVMPAWGADGLTVVKLVNAVPGNAMRGLPSVMGQVLVSDAETGDWAACLDGATLTARRTAATSALAARYLAREDAATMAMLGTGALARPLIEAMATVRPLKAVRVWGRSADKAAAVAAWAAQRGLAAQACELEEAVRGADIISCATLSSEPLVRGAWLAPGIHLDLVGAFKPSMRETDAAAVAAATVFVDTRAGALVEGGDLVQAAAEGAFAAGEEAADLAALCAGLHPGRQGPAEVTLFKSVGASIEDFAAARLALGVR